MNPSFSSDTRRTLTGADLEYLAKIGFATVPEAGSAGLPGLATLAALARRGRRGKPARR